MCREGYMWLDISKELKQHEGVVYETDISREFKCQQHVANKNNNELHFQPKFSEGQEKLDSQGFNEKFNGHRCPTILCLAYRNNSWKNH